MGLRFRKSITLCKGVKLNFGKTGASVTFGPKGFHKTIHTSGKVTTSIGLPGTGVYWTDTKNLKKKPEERRANRNNSDRDVIRENNNIEEFDMNSSVENYLINPYIEEHENVVLDDIHRSETSIYNERAYSERTTTDNDISTNDYQTKFLAEADIKNIYNRCDDIIEWTEILSGTSADDLLMDGEKWRFCQGIAGKILSGDIDTYLLAIETLRPIDDLLLYGGEFEFGTDKPTYMEVEFRVEPDKLLRNGKQDALMEELVSATAIRVSRDLMALLPISKTIVHVTVDRNTTLSVLFEKKKMIGLNYRNNSAKEIVSTFKHNKSNISIGNEIERITL